MPEVEKPSVPHAEGERLKQPTRQLSKFMCQELLFDYIEGNLDADRRKAVEQTLKQHQDLQVELGLIRAAEIYWDKLALTRISSVQIENLKAVRPGSSKVTETLRYRN